MDDSCQSFAQKMDRFYARQRHVYDISRPLFLYGREQLLTSVRPVGSSKLLEIGCGTGRNLIRLAAIHPSLILYGIDISRNMLETARSRVAKHRLTSRISLILADATCEDLCQACLVDEFDYVIASYSLSMMTEWREALRLMFSALRVGGKLHVVDFARGEDLHSGLKFLMLRTLLRYHTSPPDALLLEAERLAGPQSGEVFFQRRLRGYYQLLSVSKG